MLDCKTMEIKNTYAPGARFYPYVPEAKKKVTDYSQLKPAIARLQAMDTSVRLHEAAHIAAGGGVVTGGAHYSFVRGPDGKMYATGGEVAIDTAEEHTPEATIQKARTIVAAALAPADPSPQDFKVAATALMMQQRAQLQLFKEMQEELTRQNGVKTYIEQSINNLYKERTIDATIVSAAQSDLQAS